MSAGDTRSLAGRHRWSIPPSSSRLLWGARCAMHTPSSSSAQAASAAESALDQLDYAGVFVFVGTGSRMPRVNHNRIIVLEQTLIGAYNYDASGFGPALELLASGSLPLDVLIESEDVALDEIVPVMKRLAGGEIPGKVLVRPEVAEAPA